MRKNVRRSMRVFVFVFFLNDSHRDESSMNLFKYMNDDDPSKERKKRKEKERSNERIDRSIRSRIVSIVSRARDQLTKQEPIRSI